MGDFLAKQNFSELTECSQWIMCSAPFAPSISQGSVSLGDPPSSSLITFISWHYSRNRREDRFCDAADSSDDKPSFVPSAFRCHRHSHFVVDIPPRCECLLAIPQNPSSCHQRDFCDSLHYLAMWFRTLSGRESGLVYLVGAAIRTSFETSRTAIGCF